MGRHPGLHHSTTAPLTRSIRDRGCTHGPRHDTGHAVPESNPKSRVGRRRAVARRADNQARAMAAIAVGEREEWTAPRRVKPVNRERAPAFSAALSTTGALPERIETQGLALEEPLFAACAGMQRTEPRWSSERIERTTCHGRAGSNR